MFQVCLQHNEECVDTVAPGGNSLGIYRGIRPGYIAGCSCAGVVQDAAYCGVYGGDTVLQEAMGESGAEGYAATGPGGLPDGAALGGFLRCYKICQYFYSAGMPLYGKYLYFIAGSAR